MKRLLAALLALCLAPMACPAAARAEGGALRVYGQGFDMGQTYLQTYPGRTVEALPYTYDDMGRPNVQALMMDDPDSWDAAYLWTDECDLAALEGAGLLLDLGTDAGIAARVGGMYERVRQAVTLGGRTIGLPAYLFGAAMQLYIPPLPEALTDALGLKGGGTPKTFGGLRTLAERYTALPKDVRKGTVFNFDAALSSPKQYFTPYLIELYTASATDASGHVAFDTPAFRQALASLDGLSDALAAAGRIPHSERGAGVTSVVADGSSSLLGTVTIPLYLRMDGFDTVPARMGVLVVNAHTPRRAEALEWIAATADGDASSALPLLTPVFDYDAMARKAYDELIEAQRVQHEKQEVIDRLTAERDSGDYPRYFPKAALDAYRQNAAPYLVFPRIPSVDRYALGEAYGRGKLDADGLIAALERAVAGQ